MRYIAFILFLAATFWFWVAVSTFVSLSAWEQAYDASDPGPFSIEVPASPAVQKARKTRLLDTIRSALLSAAFLTGALYLPFRKYRKHLPFRRRAPHPVDLTALVNNVKNHPIPFAASVGVPHFFVSRRARCRAARTKLAAKINSLFAHSTPGERPFSFGKPLNSGFGQLVRVKAPCSQASSSASSAYSFVRYSFI